MVRARGTDALAAYREPIVTALIERTPLRRMDFHRRLNLASNPYMTARIDEALSLMVAHGDLERPRHGYYQIKRGDESR